MKARGKAAGYAKPSDAGIRRERPRPAIMGDRRTKRERTRGAREQAARKEYE